jgi:hypothetical protein
MTIKKRFTVGMIFALLLAVFISGTALAHYCTPANKPSGNGSIGEFNFMTGDFTPYKNNFDGLDEFGFPILLNGAFITFTDGAGFAVDIFIHTSLPEGALAAGPDGSSQCDYKGIDDIRDCLGIPH